VIGEFLLFTMINITRTKFVNSELPDTGSTLVTFALKKKKKKKMDSRRSVVLLVVGIFLLLAPVSTTSSSSFAAPPSQTIQQVQNVTLGITTDPDWVISHRISPTTGDLYILTKNPTISSISNFTRVGLIPILTPLMIVEYHYEAGFSAVDFFFTSSAGYILINGDVDAILYQFDLETLEQSPTALVGELPPGRLLKYPPFCF
jgi:hypothetical protein